MTFQPGNKLGKGRPKGSPNKNIREQALAGLARGGANIAKKAGVNGKVDGLTHFFEDLAVKNSSAAAALAGKLISSEPEQKTNGNGYVPPAINVFSVPSSCFLSLEQIQSVKKGEPIVDVEQCTPMTFEPAAQIDDNDNVVPLRLLEAPVDQEPEPQTLTALEEKLLAMSHEELLELARAFRVGE